MGAGQSEAARAARTAYSKLVDAVAQCLPDKTAHNRAVPLAFALWSMVHGILTLNGHLPELSRSSDDVRTAVKEAAGVYLHGLQIADNLLSASQA